jgi:hypothetical protein
MCGVAMNILPDRDLYGDGWKEQGIIVSYQ